MLAVAVSLLVVAVGLAVALVRTNARLRAVSDDLGRSVQAREAAEAARRSAEAEAAGARRERDDALERANRARRDAADVAKRMKKEAEARTAAEAARADAEARAEAAVAEAAAASAAADLPAAELWDLALASVRRTWEVSVAPSPGMPSPLDDSEDELRDAISIEVEAAREEAGAAIELEWSGAPVTNRAVAVRALALVQELIGRVAKVTDAAILRVTAAEAAVTVEVTGTDVEGGPVALDDLLAGVAAEQQMAPGRFELTV